MNIIEETYKWAHTLYDIDPMRVKYIVEHHEAGSGSTPQQIHNYHLSLGWSGIAYHLYVRKDGTIYRGRPINKKGGHCLDYNSVSIGICAEGNFENEIMSDVQKNAVRVATRYVKSIYPNAVVVRHKDLNATACPGKNYPFDYITSESEDETMTGEEIYNALKEYTNTVEAPEWAKDELQEAIDAGITDGTRPMELVPRYQAAIMAYRASLK